MSILLSDKSLLELPNELINEIISFLPKHPIAMKLFSHIYNFKEQYDRPFHESYFALLERTKFSYKYGMERALEIYLRKVEQLKFVNKLGLEDGMDPMAAKELYKYENTYDSDNETIYSDDIIYTDSDDDSDDDSDIE